MFAVMNDGDLVVVFQEWVEFVDGTQFVVDSQKWIC